MEEDQVSQSEDSSQVNVLSVSVTFRQRAGEESGQIEQKENGDEATDNNNDDFSETLAALRSESFPANHPATPDINTDESHIGGGEYRGKKEEEEEAAVTESAEVLKGWKGYSNNIYIQPIIVNNAVVNSCPCASSESRRRRLTSEDLRRQMRIRESSSWITKHNDLISSTGSLRVGESSGDPRQGTKTRKPRIWKGFACRQWASEFLPENGLEDEYTPFTVRSYVDRSSHFSAKTVRETAGALHRSGSLGGRSSVDWGDSLRMKMGNDGRDPDRRNSYPEAVRTKTNPEVDIHLEESEVRLLCPTDSLLQQTLEKDETNFICPCKVSICNVETFRERAAGFRESRSAVTVNSSRRSKPLGRALSVKQFPAINPLQQVEKRSHQKRGSRQERPHTVHTACLTRGVQKASGSSDLFALDCRAITGRAAPDGIIGQRIFSCPPLYRKEQRNREKPNSTVSRATGPLDMSDDDEMLRFFTYEVERWIANDSDTFSEENFNNTKKVDSVLSVNRNTTALLGSRSPKQLKVLPQSASKNERLNSAVSDLSDTGLGSEFDGFTKLDVFLKPWAENGHS